MKKIFNEIIFGTKSIHKYIKEKNINASDPFINIYNFWDNDFKTNWFRRFVLSRKIKEQYSDLTISFFSVYGNRFIIDLPKSDVKIFFTGENINKTKYLRYNDHALKKDIDLAMGFDYTEDHRYLRFPLWILYLFPPEYKEQDIIDRCDTLSFQKATSRPKFASHVSRWDHLGIRRDMCNGLSVIGKVDCDGLFMNNNDDLKMKYKDNKHIYLQNYRFNICPENSDSDGYVTEKIFQAIDAGCIPVYYGSNNNPEPDILNHNPILFWSNKNHNNDLIKEIKHLNDSPKAFKEFMMQPRLKPDAAEIIIDFFKKFEDKLIQILNEK